MSFRRIGSAMIAAWMTLWMATSTLVSAESPPDEAAARARLSAIIASASNRPATLGVLHDAIQNAISFGGPAYNAGDHDACHRFYRHTSNALVNAFSGVDATTPAAAPCVRYLKEALIRADAGTDPDRQAWTLRMGFDQSLLEWTVAQQRGEALMRMGSEYFARGQYDEALVALGSSTAVLADMRGEDATDVSINLRASPLLQAQALLGLKRYDDASAALASSAALLPELVTAKFDLRVLYPGKAADLQTTLKDLAKAVEAKTTDAALHALLGYEYRFSDRVDVAKLQLSAALAIDPKQPVAVALTKPAGEPSGQGSEIP
ncbi:MAG: hypothetical protein H0W83_11960 [Planctomycetes bacterium]|nr:hypothetical protein [Planctomycetota bacterium]